jgi:hypothetical protein
MASRRYPQIFLFIGMPKQRGKSIRQTPVLTLLYSFQRI